MKETRAILNHTVYRHLNDLERRYPALREIRKEIGSAFHLLRECESKRKKILLCGNGGSAADADHIVGELMKSFRLNRQYDMDFRKSLCSIDAELGVELAHSLQPGVTALSLTHHTSLSTAFLNDVDPYMVFAQQVAVLGGPGDLLWVISTSGNSKNILYAAVVARAKRMKVLGMTGVSGGRLSHYCDTCICVPEHETYKVQELHLPVYHVLCIMLEEYIWPNMNAL